MDGGLLLHNQRRHQTPQELAAELGEEGDEVVAAAWASGTIVKCLLSRCFSTKNVFAHVVTQKGDDEDHFCGKLAVADIEWLGNTRVIIKTDTEKAIVSLKASWQSTCWIIRPWQTYRREAPQLRLSVPRRY